MATLSKEDIKWALSRLGQLAYEDGKSLDLLVVGGAVMALEFSARESTRDIDAVALDPATKDAVTIYQEKIAQEKDWPQDWLNDGAKGFLRGESELTVLFENKGIRVSRPDLHQVLAMKLCAWRDEVDIADARLLLRAIAESDPALAWGGIEPYLVPGSELKARLAFDDLWETDDEPAT